MTWQTRGKLAGVGALFPPWCGSSGSSSGCQAWKQTPSLTEPSWRPLKRLFNNALNSSCRYLYITRKETEARRHIHQRPQDQPGNSKVRKGSREEPWGLAVSRTGGGRLGSQSSALKRGVVCVCVYTLAPGLDCPLPHLCVEVTLGDPVKQSLLNGEVQSSPDHQ